MVPDKALTHWFFHTSQHMRAAADLGTRCLISISN